MTVTLTGETARLDLRTINEVFYANGWTDGLPIVPPTPDLVREFLEHNGIDGNEVIGRFPDRNRDVTAEKIAINTVMAGCRPEYLPVVIAAVEAMADPVFAFNHIACLNSAFPHFIINGPIVKQLEMNTGIWVWGSGDRASTTISRAISLVLWNCLAQRPGDVQAGAFGLPGRQTSLVIGENEDIGWEPLHTMLGYERSENVLTCVSLYPWFGEAMMSLQDPEYLASAMSHAIFDSFFRGPYVVMIPPAMARWYMEVGWSKADLRNYLRANTKLSIARLKENGRWGRAARDFPGKRYDPEEYRIKPGDEKRFVQLFADEPGEWDLYVFSKEAHEPRADVFIVVAGGDGAFNVAWRAPHNGGQWAAKRIRGGSGAAGRSHGDPSANNGGAIHVRG